MSENEAIKTYEQYRSSVEEAADYIEHFDILETITNVGNDEVFTPRKVCTAMLDSLPEEVWHNPNYHWLNPATKNGVFEREFAIRLNEGLKDIIPDEETRKKHILQDMIFSIGQTKFTSLVARRTLYYCSYANRADDGIVAEDGHSVNGYAIGNGTWFKDEEGNIKTPRVEHVFNKDGKCIYCGINQSSKYNSADQVEHYAYEFLHQDNLQEFLSNTFFGGNTNMKFDIIIGNPPYQLSTNEKGIQAMPIYKQFVYQAKSLFPKYIAMIIPSRWYSKGMGSDDFRNSMLSDHHIRLIHDYPRSRDCFPTVDIAGGVCYFIWDSSYNGNCEIVSEESGRVSIDNRPLDEFKIFVRDNVGAKIIRKVKQNTLSHQFLDDVVFPISPFGLGTKDRGQDKEFPGSIKLISSTGVSYIGRDSIKKNQDLINDFKVSIGQLNPDRRGVNNASDKKYRVTTNIKIYGPGEVFTATYLLLNHFKDKVHADYFSSYIKTKFVRYLIHLTMTSMHITKDSFMFVPDLPMDHIWNDSELNNLFGLDDDEITAINQTIREY